MRVLPIVLALPLLLTGCDAKEGPANDPSIDSDDNNNDNDDDGDGEDSDADNVDGDGDGFEQDVDCDDDDPDINPAATEICDGIDNDCDDLVDDADDSVDVSAGGLFYADSDGDGYGDPASSVAACTAPPGTVTDRMDCDDTDANISPDATEICDPDDIDEDCDGLADDDDDSVDSSGFTTAYPDRDGDRYGDASAAVMACDPSADLIADGTDCDDTDANISPAATEICDPDDIDEDCDGLADDADDSVDPTTQGTWYVDSDGDEYGDGDEPRTACEQPSGSVEDNTDCDDTEAEINPGATELCNGLDDDCDEVADDGTLGSSESCAALSCLEVITDDRSKTDGFYYLDPDDDGADIAEAYCDLSSDGGGWTLMTWTGDSTGAQGVPYPGLDVCSTLDCGRGSAADDAFLDDLLAISAEVGIGHSTAAITDYQNLEDYDYAGGYDYGTLAGMYLDLYTGTTTACDPTGFATGTYSVIAGPTDDDGATTYVAQSFRYYSSASGYNNFDESDLYIWNIAAGSFCGGSGDPPGVWLGNWSTSEPEYGPYLGRTTGARAVYLR